MLQLLKKWLKRETHVFVHFDGPININISGEYTSSQNASILKQGTNAEDDVQVEPVLGNIELPVADFGQNIKG